MLVVLDTNIWVSEFGLNSSLGAATRFFLRQKGARIALPQVVRLETEHHLRNDLRKYIGDIGKNYRQILSIFGTLKEVLLPDDAAIESKVTDVFSNLGVELIEIAFSLESARASFLKTVDRVPPSDTTQEFKDGVLWADCITLLKSDDVYLVAHDTHFYEGRKFPNGLAKNLRDEASGASHSIRLFPKLADLLEEIKTDVSINEDKLASLFLEAYGESINNILGRNQFELGPRISVHKVLYATEQPDQLSIKFTIEYECLDTSNENRANGRLTLRGDGMHDAATGTFNGLRNYGESLSWLLGDGTEKQARNVVAFMGSMVLGHREVTHVPHIFRK